MGLDPVQQEDKREQVQPPAPMQFQVPGPKVPGWDPNQTAGPQYGMPFPPYGPPPQQWNPVMAYPPRGRGRVARSQ